MSYTVVYFRPSYTGQDDFYPEVFYIMSKRTGKEVREIVLEFLEDESIGIEDPRYPGLECHIISESEHINSADLVQEISEEIIRTFYPGRECPDELGWNDGSIYLDPKDQKPQLTECEHSYSLSCTNGSIYHE